MKWTYRSKALFTLMEDECYRKIDIAWKRYKYQEEKLEWRDSPKQEKCCQKQGQTGMHSSRMRTARLLTVSQHALPGGGMYLPGGVPARGCTCLGGVPARGYLPAGYLPRYPPMNRMTDRCKNITLPQTSFEGGNNKLTLRAYYTHFKRHVCDQCDYS